MFRTLSGFVALAALTACGAEWTVVDMDGDGVPFSEDCDESNADIGPGMDEIWYDGIDQNCDGNDADKDGDGFISVDVPAGYDWTAFEAHVAEGDCWDDPDSIPADYEIVEGEGFTQPTAAEVNPDAEDSWYDGPDQDCGGNSDFDQDGDGYDSNGWTRQDGTLGDDCADGTDRDDALQLACGDDTTLEELLELYGWTTADVNAGQATDEWYDGLDANCDGESDYDSDADGFDTCDECDDTDPDKKPTGAEEIWYDCADDDCDGNDGDQDGDGYVSVEYTEACPNWEEFSAHFNGLGADGYGDCVDDPADIPTEYTPLPGYSSIDAQDIHPTAYDMVYDGIDADCAGDTDFDGDGDGYESDDDQQRDGSYGSDCDDDEGTTYPGAQEYCETPAVDSDCDGDDNDINSIGGSTYYYDGDEDTYGELDNTGATYCEPNETTKYTSESNDDCDDGDNTIYPGATEIIADGVDDDCDNSDLCYVDDDGDGWGDDDGSTVVGDG
ncbi:MAG: hypothetical protein GY913_09460, partial [Proteobacteria bacterium]|nr:hypothetical protein [Pseudomonadota bacterium]MCP4917139.1 hypothetical protein [Pseudomonadota bacterium]